MTFAARYFPMDKVIVGKHTYGMLDVRTFCKSAGEKLQIGSFVSIADDVTFILGGQHQTNTITTFPLKAYFTRSDNNLDSSSKGPIEIDDEVWIGTRAIILSGVKIGKGAIIGAGAVVAKDVPAYTIVIGNPARVVKARFTDDIINQLVNIRLANIPEQTIQENIELFYEPINQCGSIIDLIKVLK
jgi:acetyltransferase-like isoleucine patch superfamily enzyme